MVNALRQIYMWKIVTFVNNPRPNLQLILFFERSKLLGSVYTERNLKRSKNHQKRSQCKLPTPKKIFAIAIAQCKWARTGVPNKRTCTMCYETGGVDLWRSIFWALDTKLQITQFGNYGTAHVIIFLCRKKSAKRELILYFSNCNTKH